MFIIFVSKLLLISTASALPKDSSFNGEPISQRPMIATCAAHLLAGQVIRPVDASTVAGFVRTLIEDPSTGGGQRRELRTLLAGLRSEDELSVSQYLRGSEDIAQFLREIAEVTRAVDDVLRPHLRPPHGMLEWNAKMVSAVVASAGWGSLFVADVLKQSPAEIDLVMAGGGTTALLAIEYLMARVSAYRVAQGWSAPTEGPRAGSRQRFEARVQKYARTVAVGANDSRRMSILRRLEIIPGSFARTLRDANAPAQLRSSALSELTWVRDRFFRMPRVLIDAETQVLELNYVHVPNFRGEPVLVTVVQLRPLRPTIDLRPRGPRRRKPGPSTTDREWLPGLAPAG